MFSGKARLVVMGALSALALVLTSTVGAPAARAATAPAAPTSVVAVAGDRSISVTWEAGDDGGSPITKWDVIPTGGIGAVELSGEARSVTLRFAITNGQTYAVRVYAFNAVGRSAVPTYSNEVVPAGLPSPPTLTDVYDSDAGALRVTWPPAANNGSPITSYTATLSPSGATATASWTGSYYVVYFRGLRTGVQHLISVTATNGVGTSAPVTETFQRASVSTLWPVERLLPGEMLRSPNDRYSLVLRDDGDVVVYADDTRVLWSSRTGSAAAGRLAMQFDGNLVAFAANGTVAWHSGTAGNWNARLRIQDDGNLVLYSATGAPLWYTGADRGAGAPNNTLRPLQQLTARQGLTSANGTYTLAMQADGNLVVYGAGRPLWNTRTGGKPGSRLRLQPDGNLVLYAPGSGAIWSTRTSGNPGTRLVLQDDGNLVLYVSTGRALWSYRTGRR